MSTIQQIATAIENGKVKIIEELVTEAIDAGGDPNDILEEGMIKAMSVVGKRFQENEIFVPEMLVSAKTMKKGVEILRPHLAGGSIGKMGKFIIGTVTGDLHDIGKNLVALMIESAGFEVIDLGVDVPASRFVEALAEHPDCRLVGASALLTTTMKSLKDTVEAIHAAGHKDKVKIMIGGAPVTEEFAKEIGADAYTPDAGSAAIKAIELVSRDA
ncbi:MAG: corrinoid protein [Oscillospiraceae bacterium]|nr:corrinoid protein [Oscillospiraceae bacterium]